MEYLWELIQFDETRLEVPPQYVDTIKKRMESGQPINTNDMVIPTNQIKTFRKTSIPYGQSNLLEEVSQAFNEPQIEDNSIMCRWVKKNVTQDSYNKRYSNLGYKRLEDDGGMVVIAWRKPVHTIDNSTQYCTESEIKTLTTKR